MKKFEGTDLIYFTADSHHSHIRVLEFCKETRKFTNIEEHDKYLIDSWNRVVGPDDTVYHLGDFSFAKDARETRKFFYALNGTKILITGNHDSQATLHCPWHEIYTYKELNYNKIRFCLFHYPIKEGQWNGSHRGSIHLHGHVHGKPQYDVPVRAMDVGVDVIGFSPISIEDVYKKMIKINNFVPHH